MILKGYIFTYLYIFTIIGLSSLIYKKGNGKYTRKIIYIGVAFFYIISYKYFGTTIHMIIPPLSFIILNYISYKKSIIKSMEENNSPGTVYYALSVFILALITYFRNDFYPYYGIGLFTMALGDGIAPIISSFIKSKKIYNDKTLAGSITVLIVSIIVGCIFNQFFILNFKIWEIIIIGIISSLLELLGKKGIDNLTLPLGVSIVSFVLGVI